ncbi:hypothetical protein HIM_11850 [Hirsutella minnesotensis 3608]|uniref:Methyltransferase type 11 domain-containing protein n=1 Tax=Hirsutella minnesotensis 3608 TaxID=1043627 RepID=A0A0F7ZF98_9HYPO|nr:hypothetical protein HIM_11850 [Hirsutella minnesotensis 3608]
MADAENPLGGVAYSLENVKYPFTIKEHDWDDYAVYRPIYPDSMWATWLRYHTAHGGLLDAAHDVGTGSGTVAKELSRFFSHVHASDPGKSNIVAAHRLLQPAANFTLHQAPAEKVMLKDSSVDFSSLCMALHWMDAEVVLENLARSLRPGGTLAICAYSFLINFPSCEQLKKLWSRNLKDAVRGFIDSGSIGPDELRGMRKFIVGLDGVAVPDEFFGDVVRLQVNIRRDESRPFCFAPDDQFELPGHQIKASEEVRHLDDSGWRREADVEWLKGYLASSNMPFNNKTWKSAQWVELERVINQELGGKVVVEWPVAMILATRKY